jgi:hypothetical protein
LIAHPDHVVIAVAQLNVTNTITSGMAAAAAVSSLTTIDDRF